MRYCVIAAATLSSLLVCGCATVGSLSQSRPPSVSDVQQDAVALCGFLPTAESVAQLLAKDPEAAAGLTLGSGVADLICAAVPSTKKTSAALRGASDFSVRVRGTRVLGRRVRRS